MLAKFKKRLIQAIPFFVTLWITMSCASIEIFKENVEVKNPKNYKSFVIVNKELGRKGFKDDYLDAIVMDHVQNLLEEKGLTYDRENPDILIRYTSNQDPRQKEVYANQYPMWGSRMWWDPWVYNPSYFNRQMTTSTTQSYELLQVIVDFIDPHSDKRVMTLTAVSETSSPKHRQKMVAKSTEKIIATYLKQTQTQ
jgi:hypothetical protein